MMDHQVGPGLAQSGGVWTCADRKNLSAGMGVSLLGPEGSTWVWVGRVLLVEG